MQELISLPEVEYRLLRACKTLRALPDREAKFHIVRSYWPPTSDDPDVAYGYTEERMPKFVPKPRDVSDYLIALGWIRGIERRDFRFVWWRSFGMSFGRMADFVHKSDERCRQLYRAVIMHAFERANTAERRSA